jgi:pimeloyl-ACP methyl ester carboxylesterase
VGRYIDLDGVRTWYEERGNGNPVVLLHGGLTDSRDFTGNLTALAERFRVYLPERRGHGHTPDVEGPLSVEAMAGDMVAFLERVVGGPAPLVGYSAGAIVALQVACDRPKLVDRLVLISGAFRPDGMLLTPGAEGNIPEPLLAAYAEVSPDGREHFRVVLAKLARAAEDWAGPHALTAVSCRCSAAPLSVRRRSRREHWLDARLASKARRGRPLRGRERRQRLRCAARNARTPASA